jgi:SAM-dependent methyltransferase
VDTVGSYDPVADEYARRVAGELAHKPLDCTLLDRFAASVRRLGPVLDAGCGPGHVSRYLADRGVDVIGIDVSPQMVAEARRLFPDLAFRQGDMRSLDVEEGSLGGFVAFYSLIHIDRGEIVSVLGGFRRALRPVGQLLVAFHAGAETRHLDEWWDRPVDLDFIFFEADEMAEYVKAAGFTVNERIRRPPYPDVEAQTDRVFIFADVSAGMVV